ncbi:hypothetical protein LOZ61_004430 [Ophidiomyces ophidiicola]|nr:hypothetical protein LOZ64_005277 [Ophidiomyces ophidiicola]KAI1910415.1 hypothetical protein LOZ61_004430 [Ophidiomyces ophidiicola]KAI1922462.1 hypothetical protein LOZ60_005686 [Ophidiomyces ophidiicola]KAI2001867.1 hypothetical protein LOZ50_005371 [Ophidiomyces ophidiicola]KAI2006037.1 hypothetical protein LOZ49_005184 [Ophidiomyces ophidiicola]
MTVLKFVRSVWESFRATSGLEPRLLDSVCIIPSLQSVLELFVVHNQERCFHSDHILLQLRITAARPGVVHFELNIEKQHTNRLNILHGGTTASMVDLGGSLAVASRGLFATGVSTDLNVTYLSSGGKVGDRVLAEVTCDKFGKNLAYTYITFTNSKNEIVARGSHTKYVAHAFKDPRNAVEELTPNS